MMDGEKYVRTNNAEQTEYLFAGISKDYGTIKLRNALKAATKHVEYYESLGNGKLNKTTKVIEKYEKLLDLEIEKIYPDEVESDKFVEGAKTTITINAYERNQAARQKCIKHYGATCSVCELNFDTR